MPTTTAVFRAVAEFASLNRDLRRTRRELQQLQRQAADTRSWDTLDASINKVTESRKKLLEATRKQSSTDRAAVKASDAHTDSIIREHAAVEKKASVLERLAGALGDVSRSTRDEARASASSASASAQSGSALSQQASAADRAASASRSHASASNASASASRSSASASNTSASAASSSASATNRHSSALRQNVSVTQQASRATSGLGTAYRDFSSGARQAASSGGLLRGVLLGLGVPTAVVGLTALGAILVSLVGGLVAVIGAAGPAAGALAALGPAALVAAGAAGTAVLAFRGIGKALKAATKMETQSGTSAAAAAKQRVAAAEAVENATFSLSQARRAAARAEESADEDVVAANKRLADSDRDVRRAEEDLHDARQQAIKDLEDLRELTDDNALSVEGADIALERAKQRQIEVDRDATSSALDRREAAYDVAVAEDRRADAVKKAADDQAKLVNAERAGVENAPVVLAAKQRLNDAEAARAEAARAVQRAERDRDRAIEEGAIAVGRAQEQLARAVAASKTATDEGSASAKAYKQALDNLSPAGRAFVEYLLSLRPLVKELTSAAQESFLPGLQKGIAILVPTIKSVAIPTVRAFGTELGLLAQDGARTFKSWESDLRNFGTGAGPRILDNVGHSLLGVADAVRNVSVEATPLTEWLSKLARRFGDYISQSASAARESGRLAEFFEKVKYTLTLLGHILQNVGSILYSILKASAPLGRRLLESFEAATKKTADYLKTAEGFNKLRKYFDDMEPILRLSLKLLGQLFMAFLKLGTSDSSFKVLKAIDEQLGPALGRFGKALNQVSGSLGPKIVKMLADLADAVTHMVESGGGGFFAAFVEVFKAFAAVLKALTSIPGIPQFVGALLALVGAMKALKLVGKVTGLGTLAGGVNRAVGGLQARKSGEVAFQGEPARTFVGGVARGFSGEATSGRRGPWGTGAPTASARAGALVGRAVSRTTGRGGAARPTNAPYSPAGTPVPGTPFYPPGTSRRSSPPAAPGPVARAGSAVGRGVRRAGAVVGGTVASAAGSVGGAVVGGVIGQKIGGDTGGVVGSLAGSVAGAAAPEVLASGLAKIGPLVDAAKSKFASLAQTLAGAVAGAARGVVGALGSIAGGAGKAVSSIGSVIAAWGKAAVAAVASGARQEAAWVVARGTALAGLIADLGRVALGYIKAGIEAAISAGKQLLMNAAMIAIRGAVLAWQAAQWLLNAALAANPIGIVIVVLAALVAAFILAWKHSETFRNIVIGAWNLIKDTVMTVWNNFLKPIFDAIGVVLDWVVDHWKWFAGALLIVLGPVGILIAAFFLFRDQTMAVFKAIGDFFKVIGDGIIAGINAIGGFFAWLGGVIKDIIVGTIVYHINLWVSAYNAARDAIMTAMRAVGDFIKWVADTLIHPVFQGLRDALNWVVDGFKWAVDTIDKAWHLLGDIARKPVNFVIDWVWNKGIVPIWNGIAGVFGLGKLSPLTLIPAYAEGGVLPGFSPGRDTELALLSRGEGVLVPEAVRGLGPDFVYAANEYFSGGRARQSGVQTFAEGGVVGALETGWDWLSGLFTDAVGTVRRLFSGVLSSSNNTPGEGSWVDALKNLPKRVVDLAIIAARKFASTLVSAGSASAGSGPVQAQVRAVASRYGWGSGPQWDALSWLVNKESSWNPRAQNPNSTAYGLFQFLDSTWASVGGTKTDNPGQQAEYGMRYIQRKYRDPIGARAFHMSHNWYDKGGILNPGGVGWNMSGKPERVLSPEQTALFEQFMRALDTMMGSGPFSAAAQTLSGTDWGSQIKAVVTQAVAQAPEMHAASLFAPVSDVLDRMVPELAKLREVLPRLAVQLSDSVESGSRDLTFNFEVSNPTPESASDTAARKMRTLASLGAFGTR